MTVESTAYTTQTNEYWK